MLTSNDCESDMMMWSYYLGEVSLNVGVGAGHQLQTAVQISKPANKKPHTS